MDELALAALRDSAKYQLDFPEEVGTLRSFASSMVLENVGLSAWAFSPWVGFGKGSFDYDPFEGITDEEYLKYSDTISLARSEAERDHLLMKAKKEEALRADVAANPIAGFMGGIAGGLTSPENLIPVGAVSSVYNVAKLTRNFSRAAAVSDSALTAVMSTALAEASLMQMQDQRTGEQAAIATLSSGLLVGALGGFAHSLGAAAERVSGEVYRMTVKTVEEEIGERIAATGKAAHELPRNTLNRIVQESATKALDRGPDMIARDVVEGMENPILRGFLRYGLRWAPNGKLITSAIEEARAGGLALTDMPYQMMSRDTVVPNADSAASVTKKRASMHALRTEKLSRDTRKELGTKAAQQGFSAKDADIDPVTGNSDYWGSGFFRDIKWTIANGGKYPEDIAEEFWYTKKNPISKDIVPVVERIAKDIDEFGEEHFAGLMDVNLADSGDLKGTAKGHAFRMLNPDAIEEHADLWHSEFTKLLTSEKYGFAEQEAKDIVNEWYRNITEGISRGELDLSKFVGESTIVKGRKLFIPDEYLDGRAIRDSDGNPVSFLENDIRVVLNAHMQKSAGHLEMARRFAPFVDDEWDDAIEFALKRNDVELRVDEGYEPKTPLERELRNEQALEIARSVDEIHVRRALAVENTKESQVRLEQYRKDSSEFGSLNRQSKELERELRALDELEATVTPRDEIGDNAARAILKRNKSYYRKKRKVSTAAIKRMNERLEANEAARVRSANMAVEEAVERVAKLEMRYDKLAKSGLEETARRGRGADEKALQRQKARLGNLEKRINKEYEYIEQTDRRIAEEYAANEPQIRRDAEAEIAKFEKGFVNSLYEIQRRADEDFARTERLNQEIPEQRQRAKPKLEEIEVRKAEIRARMSEVENSAKYYDDIYDGTKVVRGEVSPVGNVEAKVRKMVETKVGPSRIADFIEGRLRGIRKANAQDGVEGMTYRRWMWRAQTERYHKAKEAGASQRELNKIKSERKSEDEAFRLIRDRITNRDRFSEDPESWIHRIDSGVRKMLFLTKMGGVALSQIPDLAGHIFVNGFTPTFEGFGILMRGLKDDLMDTIGDDISEVIWSAEVAGPLQRNLLLSAITETHQKRTKIEGAMDSMVDYMSTLSLVKYVNGAQKVLASVSSSNRVIKQSMRILAGQQLSQEEMDALASVGIDMNMAKRIARMAAVYGKREKGGHWLPKTNTWKGDLEAKSAFESAVNQLVNRAIITPDAGSMPGLMSYPILRTMLSFRNFAMTSFQKHFVPALQRHDADTLATLAASTGLGAIAYSLKEMFAGRELSDDPKEYILQGMMQGGLFAIPSEFNSILENMSGGRFGVGPTVLGKPMVPSRPGADAIMGAGWGWVEDSYDTAGSLVRQFDPSAPGLGLSEGTVGKVRDTFVPMHSIFYIRRGLDVVEDWTNSFLGVEAKK